MIRSFALACSLGVALLAGAHAPALAQDAAAATEYTTRPDKVPTGMAPGLKATELSARERHFQLIFAKGDEVTAGLAEFFNKNHLTVAHFTALGAFDSAAIGWSDPDKKAYKTLRLKEEMEVTSLVGNVVRDKNGNPVVHAHVVVALLRNGAVYSGHLLDGRISLTMQMYLDSSEPLSTTEASAK